MSVTADFRRLLARLQDPAQPFPAADLYHLSDLGRPEAEALAAAWPAAPVERRRAILADLGEIGEANLEVQFEAVFRLALEDEDAEVRAAAVVNLWEAESPDLIAPFLELLQHDPAPAVRAAAASALGRFVYLGEVDKLPARPARRVTDALMAVVNGPDELEVRRRALEAVAFSSRPEVAGLIAAAYASPDRPARISAVFAMGRNADERWNATVLEELEGGDPELRYEAARAAGELELEAAVPHLRQMIQDGDVQVREAAIWSLGQVGGDDARAYLLDLLQDSGDDAERDFIQDALENLEFNEGLADFDLLDAGDSDDADLLFLDDDDLPGPNERQN